MFLKYLDLSSACRNDAIHPKVVTRRREGRRKERRRRRRKKKKEKREKRKKISTSIFTDRNDILAESTKDVFHDDKISLR